MREDLSLVLRGVAEPLEDMVMTLDEVKEIMKREEKRTYIGYEPSGPIHMGAASTILKLEEMARAGFTSIALIADVHAVLNRKGPESIIRDLGNTYYEVVFKELGSGRIKSILGSDYQLSEDYVMDLLYLSTKVTSKRAWRAMSVIARESENPYVSQMIYPLMQALDILYLKVNVAIGGTDQRKIHALARDIFARPLDLRVERYVPSAIHINITPGLLRGEKMSKSKPQTHVAVHDPPELIIRKMNSAYCPPSDEDQYDQEGNLRNPVLGVFRDLILRGEQTILIERARSKGGGVMEISDYKELEKLYISGEIHPADLKRRAADYLIDLFEPIRERFESEPELIKPLYYLQRWQRKEGLFGDLEWKLALESMKPYLGELS